MIEQWKSHLIKHSNRYFVVVITKIIRQSAKIEYIDSSRFLLSKNHFFVSETFDILTTNVNKQLIAERFIIMFFVFFDKYICSSLSFVSKFNDDWRRIHDLFFSKSFSINCFISGDWKTLKYVFFDEIINALLAQNRKIVLFKKNFVDVFKHVFVIVNDRWLLDFQ